MPKFFKPMIIVFIISTIIFLLFSNQFDNHNIDHAILLWANVLLFILMIITSLLHIRASHNSNPYAFVRSITLGVFLKLIVVAGAALIYFNSSKGNINIFTVAIAMLLYLIYTIIEVTGAMRLNRKKNG